MHVVKGTDWCNNWCTCGGVSNNVLYTKFIDLNEGNFINIVWVLKKIRRKGEKFSVGTCVDVSPIRTRHISTMYDTSRIRYDRHGLPP